DELIKYSNNVVNEGIVACEKHKWACRRFLFDLEREGTESFPYVFDEGKAQRFLDWMSFFKHTKGPLQGTYINPVDIQKFVFGNVYGWIHKNTGLRRFNKFYWQVARKNAKSQSLSCVASYEAMAFGENMSEVYIGATKTEQARIVWNEVKAQLDGNPDLHGKYHVAYWKINHEKSGSYITALSKDAGKTGDGLHVQAAIIDEYHAHQDSSIHDVLVSGQGARSQPLTAIITTAGFDLNNPCYRVEYKYISQILDPNSPVSNDNYFVMVNELDKDDDIKNPDNWEKANPIICSSETGKTFLKKELKIALDVPEKMRNFLTKNMNIWVDAKDDGYMNMSKWNECVSKEMDLRKYPVWIGIDLSTTTDLSSIGMVFRLDDGSFAIKQ